MPAIINDEIPQFFDYAIMPQSKLKLNALTSKLRQDILRLFAQRNYELITEHLDILKVLKDATKFNSIHNQYQQTVKELIDVDFVLSTLKKFEIFCGDFEDSVQLNFENLIECIKYLSWIEQLKSIYPEFRNKILTIMDLIQQLEIQMEMIIQVTLESENCKIIRIKFKKLESICNNQSLIEQLRFSSSQLKDQKIINTQDLYQQFLLSFENRIDRIVSELNNQIFQQSDDDKSKLQFMGQNLKFLQNAINEKLDSFIQIDFQSIYDKFIKQIVDDLDLSVDKIIQINNQSNMFEESLAFETIIRQNYTKIYQFNHNQIYLKEFFKAKYFDETLEKVQSSLIQKCIYIFDQLNIGEKKKKKKLPDFDKSLDYIKQIQKLHHDIENQTLKDQFKTNHHIKDIIQKHSAKAIKLIQQLKDDQIHDQYINLNDLRIYKKDVMSLLKCLQKLKSSQILNNTEADIQSVQIFKKTEQEFQKYTINMEKIILNFVNKLPIFAEHALLQLHEIQQNNFYQNESQVDGYVPWNSFIEIMKNKILDKITNIQKSSDIQLLDQQFSEITSIIRFNMNINEVLSQELIINNQLLESKKNEMLHIFRQLVYENIYNFAENQFPQKNFQKQNDIANQLQSLKQHKSLYQEDFYLIFLNKIKQHQQEQETQIEKFLNDTNFTKFEQITDLITQYKNSKLLYDSHLPKSDFKLIQYQYNLTLNETKFDKKMKALIDNLEIDQLLEIYNKLTESEYKNNITKLLKQQLKQIIQQTKNQIEILKISDIELIKMINGNLKIITEASNKLKQINFYKFNILEEGQKIFKSLNLYFNQMLTKILQLTKEDKIYEAYLLREQIANASQTLGIYLDKNEQNKLLGNCLTEIQNYLKNIYSRINIQMDQNLIVQILENLNCLKQDTDYLKYFEGCIDIIDKQISNKVDAQMKKLLQNEYQTDPETYFKEQITKYEKLINILCRENKMELNNYFEKKQNFYQNLKQKIFESLETHNTEDILKLLNYYPNHMEIIINQVINQSALLTQEIAESFETQNFTQAQKSFTILNNYQNKFANKKSNFSAVKVKFQEACEIIKHKNNKFLQTLQENLNNLNDESLIELLVQLNQYDQFCLEFSNTSQTIQNSTVELLNSFKINLQNIQLDLYKYCQQLQDISTLVSIKQIQLIQDITISIDQFDCNLIGLLKKFLNRKYNKNQKQNDDFIQKIQQVMFLQQEKTNDDFKNLDSVLQNGIWTLKDVEDYINLIYQNIIIQMNDKWSKKQYQQAIQEFKTVKQFQQTISKVFKNLNLDKIRQNLKNLYEKQVQKAFDLWNQRLIDCNLYNQMKDLELVEQLFKENQEKLMEKSQLSILINQMEDHIQNELENLNNHKYDNQESQIMLANKLMMIRSISFEIGYIHDFTINQMAVIMKKLYETFNSQEMNFISRRLNEQQLGQLIITEQKGVFEFVQLQRILNQTKNQFDLNYISNNMSGDKIIKQELENNIMQYFDMFRALTNKYNQGEITSGARFDIKYDDKSIFVQTKNLMNNFHQKQKINLSSKIQWTKSQKYDLIQILTYVCACWTLMYMEENKKCSVLKEPHIIQIMSILRLIGIDTKDTQYFLENHLIQIRTGEGKSITLGITAILLAFLGFHVDCACYSKQLSQRDYDDFKNMFQKLNLEEKISYGTFDELFEKINQDDDIRSKVNQILENEQINLLKNQKINQTKKTKVFLIDEVDFYFGDNFIGECYILACQFSKPEVISLFLCIWNHRQEKLSLQQLKSYPEYLQLYTKNPGLQVFKDIIDQNVQLMLQDVQEMAAHSYYIHHNETTGVKLICYKQLDGVSINMVKGYKTAFAYIQEWEKKVISEDVMRENLCFSLRVGCYAFVNKLNQINYIYIYIQINKNSNIKQAEILKQYSLILGVSGTLEFMAPNENKLIKDVFNIKKETYVPSIFGISCKKDQQSKMLQQKFNIRIEEDIFDEEKDVFVEENEEQYYAKLVQVIQREIKDGGAVLVFLENNEKIRKLQGFLSGDFQIQTLTQQTNQKNYVISRTAKKGQITLADRWFDRGQDFICTDPSLDSRGLLVIMSFWPLQLSEQKQCQGRTARQFQKGTFRIIINKSDLIKNFGLDKSQVLKNNANLYKTLSNLRQKVLQSNESSQNTKIHEAQNIHNISIELKEILLKFTNSKEQINKIKEKIEIISKFQQYKGTMTNKYVGSFYNVLAGKIGIGQDVAELDKFNNPIGNKFDLGIDGAFGDFSILIGCFYQGEGLPTDLVALCIPELKKKGYKKIEMVNNEATFIQQLPEYDQAWIISSYVFGNTSIQNEFVDSIIRHLDKQKGLMIWGDNQPFYVHANLILQKICLGYENSKPIFMNLFGNDPGNQILSSGSYSNKQQFGPHEITTGLNQIHEGITICYPKIISDTNQNNFGNLQLIGNSSASRPCIIALEGNENRGRIIIDCGWTKLLNSFWVKTAGTIRYVQNCTVWLMWVERLFQQ